MENVKGGTAFRKPMSSCPHDYEKLTDSCCSREPSDRPTFEGSPITRFCHSYIYQSAG